MKTKKADVSIRSSAAEYLTYTAASGNNAESIEMRYEDENIWLTQKMLAELFDVSVSTINYHINKILEDNELNADSVIRNFRITAADAKNYQAKHYGLQMTIAVGFKVNSERAVQFRKWVNEIAMSYTIKGWGMDDERLKLGTTLTDKYFKEQLENPMTMQDWETRLNRFVEMMDYGLLKDAGSVSAEIAKLHALTEFQKYRVIQDQHYLSDFDRFMLDAEKSEDEQT